MKNTLYIKTMATNVVLMLAFIFGSFNLSFAQNDTKGTDFYFMFNRNDVDGHVAQISLFITSDVNTSGTVTVSGIAFSAPFVVTANTVTTVTLPTSVTVHTSDVVDQKAIHVTALDEVSVYGLNRAQFTTDAFTALPTDILGTNYLYLNYKDNSQGHLMGIVGTQNATTVTITPKITVGVHPANVPYNVTLNAGDSYELMYAQSGSELTGSSIVSDKPVGVMGSNRCANIPTGVCCCDHIVEMLFPTSAWGKNFLGVPLATRTGGDTWRILASENGTTVTINGAAQPMINAGAFIETSLGSQSVITSDKPVLVAQYSKSQFVDNVVSDPFMMLIMPTEQYLAGYTVTTPASGFSQNFINLVAPNSIVGALTIDAVPVSAGMFTPIGASGYSGAKVSVALGSHTLAGSLPFGCFVYGFDSYDSYGYPGGGSLSPIAQVTTLVLTPETGTDQVNNNNCWQALVSDQFNDPVAGIRVDFSIIGVNNTISGFAFTDANGIANFCYAGPNEGLDSILANAGSVGDTSTFTWTPSDPCAGVVIDDGDPCTIDACDPATGQVSHTDNSPVVTATAGTIACYGGATTVTVTATGGQPPYMGEGTYNATAGTSTYTVVDDNGCAATSDPVVITQPSKLKVSTSTTPTSCAGNDGTATATPTDGTPGYTYSWSPGGQTTSTITGLVPGLYTVTVTDANGCTTSSVVNVLFGGSPPAAPTVIYGADGACKGSCRVYSIDPIPGAVSYEWYLPSGAIGYSSGPSITVCFNSKFIGGYICVRGLNQCGAGPRTCKGVYQIPSKPGKPGSIYGNTFACSPGIETYCVPTVLYADSYLWTIEGSGGANPLTIVSGQGTPCVSVNIPPGYGNAQKLKVVAVNCLGTGSYLKVDIKLTTIPSAPGSISGPSSVCKSQKKNYSISSVAGATYYSWSITGGATIISGQGTTNIKVDFNTAASNSAVLSVTADNSCGSSSPATYTVAVNLSCKVAADEPIEAAINNDPLAVYPNPTNGRFTVSCNSERSTNYLLRVINISGQVMYSKSLAAASGINTLDIDLSGVAKGVYFVTLVSDEGNSQSIKLVME